MRYFKYLPKKKVKLGKLKNKTDKAIWEEKT